MFLEGACVGPTSSDRSIAGPTSSDRSKRWTVADSGGAALAFLLDVLRRSVVM